LSAVGFSFDRTVARIDLGTAVGRVRIDLALEGSCDVPPRASQKAPATPAGSIAQTALTELAAGFPAPKIPFGGSTSEERSVARSVARSLRLIGPARVAWLTGIEALLWPEEGGGAVREPWRLLDYPIFLAGILLLLFLVGRTRRPGASSSDAPSRVDTLVLIGLAALVAYPLFSVPFTTDAQVIRAWYAVGDLFSDPRHPFLSFLLNRPAAWISLEPWVLRIAPFVYFVVLSLLLAKVSWKAGGRIAGILAVAWFIPSERVRRGIIEIGDWDLAGCFLMALVLWLQHYEPRMWVRDRRPWIVLALLVLGGMFSSFLFIVPAGALIVVLWFERVRQSKASFGPLLVTAAFVLPSVLVVFRFLHESPPASRPDTAADLLAEIFQVSPMGRTWLMVGPLLLGFGWLVGQSRRLTGRFALISLLGLVPALLVAWQWSWLHGGYYAGLMIPLALFASAVGVAASIAWVVDHAPGLSTRPRLRTGVASVLVVGTVLATVDVPPVEYMARTSGVEHLAEFESRIAGDRLPVLTNGPIQNRGLEKLTFYDKARRGEVDIAGLGDGTWSVGMTGRMRFLDVATCQPAGGWEDLGPEFYLVTELQDQDPVKVCRDALAGRCDLLFPAAPGQDFLEFYRCGKRGQEPGRPPASGP